MNVLSAIIDGIVSFVKNNTLTVVIIVMLAVFVPSLFGAVLIGLLVVLLLLVAWPAFMLLRLRREARRMEKEASDNDFGRGYYTRRDFRNGYYTRRDFRNGYYTRREYSNRGGSRNPDEGEVKVYTTAAREKRVKSDVGDYVDFEEVKEKGGTRE